MSCTSFETKSKGPVEIRFEDDDQITVFDQDGRLIGNVDHRHIEGPDEDGSGDCYLITNIFLEGPDGSCAYKRQGIGRECIRTLAEDFRYNVIVSIDDGNTRGDGSHLTGDASAFFARMVEEGLVSWESDGGAG